MRSNMPAATGCMRRVEQLRLLSKAEQAGLLSLAERAGLTLTFIEQSGLLSKAESLGILSLATDRCGCSVKVMQRMHTLRESELTRTLDAFCAWWVSSTPCAQNMHHCLERRSIRGDRVSSLLMRHASHDAGRRPAP